MTDVEVIVELEICVLGVDATEEALLLGTLVGVDGPSTVLELLLVFSSIKITLEPDMRHN